MRSLDAELAEIDENLVRNGLHYPERGDLLVRRQEIYEARHPETKNAAKGRWNSNKAENLENEIISLSSDSDIKTNV